MNERWITISEVAELLEISRPTARKMLRDGDVPGLVDHFGYSRVERAVFEAWRAKRVTESIEALSAKPRKASRK